MSFLCFLVGTEGGQRLHKIALRFCRHPRGAGLPNFIRQWSRLPLFLQKPLIRSENKCIILEKPERQVTAVKKLIILIITLTAVLLLSMSASALHTIDGATVYPDVQVNGDGVVEVPEKVTLGQIENLQFVQSARGSVTLSWDKLANAYAYNVFVKFEGDEKYRYSYTVRNNKVTIGDIENEGELKFKVRGFRYDKGKVVCGKFSSVVKAVTKPESVSKIYTRSITDDSITLYWDKAKGATGYRVYLYDKKSEKFEVYKETSRTTLTVSELEKDARYSFKVMSYKEAGNSKAFGDNSPEYKELTYNSGSVPHTTAQVAQHYNELITNLKAVSDMSVQYKKTIDTEYVSCSKNNLAMTVKNTLSLFEGTLKKTYKYAGGTNEEKSANKLIEPYGKKPSLMRDDIQQYTVTEKENGDYTIKIILKSESKLYEKGSQSQKSYSDGVLALPEFRKLKTGPLSIESADSYYDGGTITATVKKGRITSLDIGTGVLSVVDFSVADVRASTVVGYEMTESYKVKYNGEAQ